MTDSVSHVVGNLQDTIARMALKLDEIRQLHSDDGGYCSHCRDLHGAVVPYPCETMRIVERVEL